MSTMTEELCSGSVLPPGRSRRSFPKEFKADEARRMAHIQRTLDLMVRSSRT